jgi:hypothetical protein
MTEGAYYNIKLRENNDIRYLGRLRWRVDNDRYSFDDLDIVPRNGRSVPFPGTHIFDIRQFKFE